MREGENAKKRLTSFIRGVTGNTGDTCSDHCIPM
uniref:Uncharacterized protein n=1 Tax=Lepeophtheirus salmonis TaxID=72036 RepID=A0A0K2U256_LEPSM